MKTAAARDSAYARDLEAAANRAAASNRAAYLEAIAWWSEHPQEPAPCGEAFGLDLATVCDVLNEFIVRSNWDAMHEMKSGTGRELK